MDPIYPNVYGLFETLARDALGILCKMQEAGRVGVRKVPHLKIQRPGSLTWPSDYIPDWYLPMYGVLSDLRETPGFREFKLAAEQDAHLGARMNTLIGTKSQLRRMEPWDFLQILVHRLVDESPETLNITDDQRVGVWNATVRSVLAKKATLRFWSILENVEIPVGQREILPSVSLLGLSDDDIQHLWDNDLVVQNYYPIYGHYFSSILNVQTLLETVVEEDVIVGDYEIEPKTALSSLQNAQSAFESVLTTLRLLKPEPIVMTPIVAVRNDLFGGTAAYGTRMPMLKPFGGPCKLNDDELDELCKLLQVINHPVSRQSRSVTICLRRIGYANTRMSGEDRLLDIMMALEALVLADSGKPENRQELSFRLAIRLARFLGGNGDEMLLTYNLVRAAYKLRSKVIHGDQLEPVDAEVIGKIEDLTKSATRKYLQTLSDGEKVDWTALMFNDCSSAEPS